MLATTFTAIITPITGVQDPVSVGAGTATIPGTTGGMILGITAAGTTHGIMEGGIHLGTIADGAIHGITEDGIHLGIIAVGTRPGITEVIMADTVVTTVAIMDTVAVTVTDSMTDITAVYPTTVPEEVRVRTEPVRLTERLHQWPVYPEEVQALILVVE